MFKLPFFTELEGARRVLLAGAGGGYDVFCGLPLYHALRAAGKQVFLANISFTVLAALDGRRPAPAVLEVTADTAGPPFVNYFPEGYLCQWLRREGEEVTVYCFERTGVGPLREAYRALAGELGVDTVVLVDGGTDSLMRGDEPGLGTPQEDVASIAAVDDLPVARKLLVCLGFGVDAYHGVCHYHFLEAVAELTRTGDFLGAFSLLADMPEVQRYSVAAAAVHDAMPQHPSIVTSSILSALEGRYGDYHATTRTAGSKLWINPLMTLYWAFRLDAVARRILYLEAMKKTENWAEVNRVILEHRARCPSRPWRDMPA
jgi:hypothetical protein